MDSSSDLELAWNELNKHWYIKPYNGNIPNTPGYSFIRFIFSPLIRGLMRIRATGLNNIPASGPTILAANHLSHVDPVLIIASSRRKAHYLAKDGHFKNFWLRQFMKMTGQIKTQREEGGDQALSSAADVLSSRSALGIFPEGTRSKRTESPLLLPGKTGVARLAASYPDTVVMPISLNGTREMMAPQIHKLPRLWKPIKVDIGKGITWLEWLEDPKGGNTSAADLKALKNQEEHEIKAKLATLYRKFTDQLMASIKHLGAP
jgi:1-acyl-sn-glycerol-3-phosphate acyltransferase